MYLLLHELVAFEPNITMVSFLCHSVSWVALLQWAVLVFARWSKVVYGVVYGVVLYEPCIL
jgi:hypothetical protein